MPPGAVQFGAVFGDRGDAQAGAGQPVSGQPLVQPLRQLPRGEGGRVDPLQRLVERLPHVQVRRWPAGRERALVPAGGQPVGQHGV